ncbi:SdpI family protein [Nocardiopsis kunsanensis]|uniref:SdpI family protein n=1 Tax=Nocardiopsis kunsanensis TaxID=141693 RepID=UPI001E3DC288|nr:SdpI family protein [Nocardiopsis kunsanensis]
MVPNSQLPYHRRRMMTESSARAMSPESESNASPSTSRCTPLAGRTEKSAGPASRCTPAAFGIRTKRTLESERAWYHVHRSAAPWLTISAGILLAGALVPFFTGTGAAQFTAIMVGCVLYVGVLCTGAIRAHRTIPSTTVE